MYNILKSSLLLSTAFMLSGCGTLGAAPNIGPNIVDDAMQLNEAYGQVSNAVIIKNILRARDRWPTTYTTLSGITSNPTLTRGADINLSPLGLGNPSGPFQSTTSKFSNSSKAGNSYSVAPYSAGDEGGAGLLTPISADKMEDYFTRWPKDVVFITMVDGVKTPSGFLNSDGENIAGFIYGLAKSFGLNDYQISRFDLGRHIRLLPDDIPSRKIDRTNQPEVKQYVALNPDPNMHFSQRQVDLKFEIERRSFDDMIYFLGESLRRDQFPMLVECTVHDNYNRYTTKVPAKILDLTLDQHAAPVNYAVRLSHADETYLAMPNARQYTQFAECLADRTSTVVSLLSQILILGQNPKALNATTVFVAQ